MKTKKWTKQLLQKVGKTGIQAIVEWFMQFLRWLYSDDLCTERGERQEMNATSDDLLVIGSSRSQQHAK